MTLTTYSFLLLFLPCSLILYWKVFKTRRSRLLLIFLLNVAFYFFAGGYRFLILILILSFSTYYLGKKKRALLGIIINLVPLIFYKLILPSEQLGFTIINSIFIPLGISYYTFKHIGYLIDTKQKRYAPTKSLLVFMTYSTFFPQIVAGPVSNYIDTGKQLSNLPLNLETNKITISFTYIIWGLSKKLLIGDMLAETLSQELIRPSGDGLLWSWILLIIFACQIYFDFSGYTDIALGVAYAFGITIPQNFDNPFLSHSPRDFWNRWHISISNWFRFYVFFPLSRSSMKYAGRKYNEQIEYFSLAITMFLIGVWHDFTLGFCLWGLYNGFLLSFQSWGNRRKIDIYPESTKTMISIAFIILGFGLIIYPDIQNTGVYFTKLLGENGLGEINLELIPLLNLISSIVLVLSGLVETKNIIDKTNYQRPGLLFLLGLLGVLCISKLGGEVTTFVYARF